MPFSTLNRRTPLKPGKGLRPVSKRKPTRVYAIANGVMTYPDGREACTQSTAGLREYDRRTWEMTKRQGYACAMCEKAFTEYRRPTFDHADGRTSGNLDERITKDGQWYNAALCMECNGRKGSRKFHWLDGRYVQKVKA